MHVKRSTDTIQELIPISDVHAFIKLFEFLRLFQMVPNGIGKIFSYFHSENASKSRFYFFWTFFFIFAYLHPIE